MMSNLFKYNMLDLQSKMWRAYFDIISASALYWAGIIKYNQDFFGPMYRAYTYFARQELLKMMKGHKQTSIREYEELLNFGALLAMSAWKASVDKAWEYHSKEYSRFVSSFINTLQNGRGEKIDDYAASTVKALEKLVVDFPRAVQEVRKDYGFHLDDGRYVKTAETDRMLLYQVLPTERDVKVNPALKPVLISHPYVLGSNILAFLPGERKSYVHSFANQGIPTYARIIKDIRTNPAVQVMTGEDDALDTRFFAELMVEKHGKPVTLNGACQGGLLFLADLLSGQLDGLVDALITAASPLDGSKSPGLRGYLDGIPEDFRDLAYATRILPNGNRVIDGQVMSLIYKLKSIDKEFPLSSFYNDINLFEENTRKGVDSMSKTGLAIGYWLLYDRTDLPVKITELSAISYTKPISKNGDLPFTLFGKKLNLRHISEKKIKLLICYGAADNLVEPACALAPLDYIDAETTEFPKGHAAMFTSWSNPESKYALHKRFANGQRGPVRFHLDLDAAASPLAPHKKAACW
jgi:hypothetical protein